jgi:protein PhnA
MKRFPVLVSFLFVLARSSAFTIHPPATALSLSRTALFSSIPEPGPCPSCNDDNAYWDGSSLFVCTACDHEWPVDELQVEEQATEDNLTRDSNGFVLETGDTCVLIKDLAKGKLKKGLKVKIRLGDYGDGHDCQANIADVGTYALKSEFLKKV